MAEKLECENCAKLEKENAQLKAEIGHLRAGLQYYENNKIPRLMKSLANANRPLFAEDITKQW